MVNRCKPDGFDSRETKTRSATYHLHNRATAKLLCATDSDLVARGCAVVGVAGRNFNKKGEDKHEH